MITYSLFNRIIEFLEYQDVPEYSSHYEQELHCILYTLLEKKQSLELRDAYSQFIFAKNDDDRHQARIQYLRMKSLLNESF